MNNFLKDSILAVLIVLVFSFFGLELSWASFCSTFFGCSLGTALGDYWYNKR